MKNISADEFFFPTKAIEIHETKFFAGRKVDLIDCIKAMETPHTSAIVCGDRGVGKTSFAWQLFQLLSGNKGLYQLWEVEEIPLKHKYVCFWVQCESSLENITNVLLSLINITQDKSSFYHKYSKLIDKLDSTVTAKFRAGVFGLRAELIENLDKTDLKSRINKLANDKGTITMLFRELLYSIKERFPQDEIIIFIDEVDRLRTREGIGDLIKTTDNARFVIIGMGDNYQEIISDHASAKRRIEDSVYTLTGLSSEEVNWLFDKIQEYSKSRIVFSPTFRNLIFSKSSGQPSLVQRLGHSSLREAIEQTENNEDEIMVDEEVFNIALNKYLNNKYKDDDNKLLLDYLDGNQIIGIEVLHAIAKKAIDWIPLKEIRDQISIGGKKHTSAICDELTQAKILKKRTDRKGEEAFKFSEPIHKIIASLHAEM